MKRFQLVRTQDVSGVSGTGRVVEGVQFGDGTCVMRWLGDISSKGFYDSVEDVLTIHGHGGATTVKWIDDNE